MIITRRQPGDRRWGFPAEFPLVDSEGFLVPVDRRQFLNRRKADTSLMDVLLSRLSAKDTDR
jgi:hypothetical protein